MESITLIRFEQSSQVPVRQAIAKLNQLQNNPL
jgi:hypothetical protein